jgi:hypothetical protein
MGVIQLLDFTEMELLEHSAEENSLPSENIEADKKELHTKKNSKEIIIIFRNKIYKIVKEYNTLWYVYEYYASFNKDSTVNIHVLALSIDTTDKEMKAYDKNLVGTSFDNFIQEMEEIEESDVPTRIVECIMNIQRSKVAPEIPYKKILEHEEIHLANIKKEYQKAIDTFMMVVYETLAKSKTALEKITYVFIANEYKIQNGCKIFYKHPNADGKMRPTFQEYFHYLFEKLYPRHEADQIDDSSWMQYVIYTKLKEKYTFLKFEFVGAPKYIEVHLPCKDLLH